MVIGSNGMFSDDSLPHITFSPYSSWTYLALLVLACCIRACSRSERVFLACSIFIIKGCCCMTAFVAPRGEVAIPIPILSSPSLTQPKMPFRSPSCCSPRDRSRDRPVPHAATPSTQLVASQERGA